MEIICPKCKTRYRVSDAAAGKSVRCKAAGCGETFTATNMRQNVGPAAPPSVPCVAQAPVGDDSGTESHVSASRTDDCSKSPTEPDYRSIVDKIIRQFSPQQGIYLAGDIPPTMEQHARKNCSIQPCQGLIALVDCTISGSGKNCLVFTETDVVVHNNWTSTTKGTFTVPYSEFPSRLFGDARAGEISMDRKQYANVSTCAVSQKKLITIFREIKAAIAPKSATNEVSAQANDVSLRTQLPQAAANQIPRPVPVDGSAKCPSSSAADGVTGTGGMTFVVPLKFCIIGGVLLVTSVFMGWEELGSSINNEFMNRMEFRSGWVIAIEAVIILLCGLSAVDAKKKPMEQAKVVATLSLITLLYALYTAFTCWSVGTQEMASAGIQTYVHTKAGLWVAVAGSVMTLAWASQYLAEAKSDQSKSNIRGAGS